MTDTPAAKTRYFLTYTGVRLPLRLTSELEPGQIENRNTFFRGDYDAQDRLILLEKISYGELEMAHRYAYFDNGVLKQADIIDADGDVRTVVFSEDGLPAAA